ncbi:MAG: 5'/3'-nucleotidase SurE [Deltaproteobacteria bacterium]|nr:MAG: 5'/3'-nucleotidase SurE [Deltaproteobacteria bacterium]
MRILVSNDDGVEAPGLRALVEALALLGEVVVCAPDREQSATSRSISLHRPLRIEKLPPWGAVERWAVDGTPTDAVYIGLNHVLKARRPDVVASGINRGPNLANDVHYSGTVAAAMEGCVGGVPSFAISQVKGRDYQHAARFAAALAGQVAKHGLPNGTLLNVNVPRDPTGAQITKIGKRSYLASVVEKLDPRGRAYYWIGGDEQAHENVPGSDCNAVFDRGLISVTPLHLDLTQHALVEELRGWDLPGLVRD